MGGKPLMATDEKFVRTKEAEVCAKIAQDEGDRLLAAHRGPSAEGMGAAEACWRIAAIIRQRRDKELSPF